MSYPSVVADMVRVFPPLKKFLRRVLNRFRPSTNQKKPKMESLSDDQIRDMLQRVTGTLFPGKEISVEDREAMVRGARMAAETLLAGSGGGDSMSMQQVLDVCANNVPKSKPKKSRKRKRKSALPLPPPEKCGGEE